MKNKTMRIFTMCKNKNQLKLQFFLLKIAHNKQKYSQHENFIRKILADFSIFDHLNSHKAK